MITRSVGAVPETLIEGLSDDVVQIDHGLRCEPMVTRHHHHERFPRDEPELEIGHIRFRPKEGHVELAAHKILCKIGRVLA